MVLGRIVLMLDLWAAGVDVVQEAPDQIEASDTGIYIEATVSILLTPWEMERESHTCWMVAGIAVSAKASADRIVQHPARTAEGPQTSLFPDPLTPILLLRRLRLELMQLAEARVGRYYILKYLGSGASSAVYSLLTSSPSTSTEVLLRSCLR